MTDTTQLKIAELLHKRFCRADSSTMQCGWDFGLATWEGKYYMGLASELIDIVGNEGEALAVTMFFVTIH